MFTGIVQSQAEVASANIKNNLLHLCVVVDLFFIDKLEIGASIANNGVCLTVVKFVTLNEKQGIIHFDVIDETLCVTNLGSVKVGDKINVERSLKVGDELGGHIVSGHIHSMATLITKEQDTANCRLTFEFGDTWQRFILPKGFITINGISLTVGEIIKNTFTVHLIPETLTRTNLSQLSLGDKVNLEFDQQTITIVETLQRMQLSHLFDKADK